jgi:Ca2+-binding RTX toxin-like protein
MRRIWIGTAAVVALLAPAAPAVAATAYVEASEHGHAVPDRSHLWVTSSPGESNHVTVIQSGDGVLVSDSTPVTPGAHCEPRPGGSVLCHPAPGRWSAAHLELGDLDDAATSELPTGFKVYLSGGAGDDVLTASDAETVFTGGPGRDRMTGGKWDDVFLEGKRRSGSDVIRGGSHLSIHHPRPRVGDVVSYADRREPVVADVGGGANDGEPGERDDVGSDVESLLGGRAGDVLTGAAGPNSLDGGAGHDLLRGLGGRDGLYGRRGGDRIHDGGGFDDVRAGPGRDRIRSARYPDHIWGGPGNDVIRTRDDGADRVACGGGWDQVLRDPLDYLIADCERRPLR